MMGGPPGVVVPTGAPPIIVPIAGGPLYAAAGAPNLGPQSRGVGASLPSFEGPSGGGDRPQNDPEAMPVGLLATMLKQIARRVCSMCPIL